MCNCSAVGYLQINCGLIIKYEIEKRFKKTTIGPGNLAVEKYLHESINRIKCSARYFNKFQCENEIIKQSNSQVNISLQSIFRRASEFFKVVC